MYKIIKHSIIKIPSLIIENLLGIKAYIQRITDFKSTKEYLDINIMIME